MDTMKENELGEIDMTEIEIDAMIAEGEPAKVTGPFDPVRRVQFELIGSGLHTYRWRLIAANGEVLATSANSYRSQNDAHQAVSALTAALQQAPIVSSADTA